MKNITKILVTILLITVVGFLFSKWISGVKFWSEVVGAKNTWNYAIVKNTTSTFNNKTLAEINWNTPKKDEKISITEKTEESVFLLKTSFELADLKNIESVLVEYDYKYSTKIYINNTLCYTKDRNLISPIIFTETTSPISEINVEEYWRATKAFLPKDNFYPLLKTGKNTLIVLVYNLEKLKSIKPTNIKVSILSNKIKPNKSAFIKAAKPNTVFSESQLPIFSINTNHKVIPDEPKISSILKLYDNGKINNLADSAVQYQIKIERRGFTSQSFAKKSYGFTIYENKSKKSTPLCGLATAKKWVLYGPFADKSLIRNALTYSLYRKMGHYAPNTKFINLIVNNNYQGIYLLTEKINTDKNHLNLPKFTLKGKNNAQGGYLLEIDRNTWHAIYPPLNDTTSIPAAYSVYSPKVKKLPEAIQLKIKEQYNRFEKQVYENSPNKYDYFDVNSFVDYFIISEFTKNIDAYRLSTFLYNKDINSSIPKFYIDPIWDYNFSFGLTDYNEGYKPEGFVYTSTKFIPFWWEKLMKDSTFKHTLKTRYTELRKTVLSTQNINQQIDSLYQITSPAAKYNFKKWPVLNSTDFWPNYYNGETYEDEINYIKQWSEKRLVFLDSEILKQH